MVAAGVVAARSGARSLGRWREVRKVPTGRIGDPPAGVAEVLGTALGAAPLVAPITRRPCVLWRCRFLGPWDALGGRRLFDTRFGEGDLLSLADDTGHATVEAAGADVRGPHRIRVAAAKLHGYADSVDLVLRFRREMLGKVLPTPRYVEITWVEPGDRVHVLGRIERRTDPEGELEGGYRGLPVRVHMTPGPWGAPIVSHSGGARLRRELALQAAIGIVGGTALAALGVGTFLAGFFVP